MESTGRRARRAFTDEYKAEVVELCRTSGKTVAAVARDLGLTATVVRRWVTQAEIDGGRRDGLSTSDREEIARLRKEVRVLREERDILKRATVFFAAETRCTPTRSSRRRRLQHITSRRHVCCSRSPSPPTTNGRSTLRPCGSRAMVR